MPPLREVPQFAPVRVRGGRWALHRLVRHRRRTVAAGLAMTAAVLVAAPGSGDAPHLARGHPPAPAGPAVPAASGSGQPVRPHSGAGRVSAPVRIADAATVRLLRRGDRVDVIAAEDAAAGGRTRVVARGARVTEVPEGPGERAVPGAGSGTGGGALVVLSVPRATATRLAGASATARLAVTLW
ncbi:hypothetical protein [Streptomyces poriticola]|uniref:hypothetical protein n=1 Tax=Streptomyces poriticola TaxID=3120506 RepID=UPI002FCE342D